MKVVGLDLSARSTGVALIDGPEQKGKVVALDGVKGFPRLHLIAQNLIRTIEAWEPDRVVIENYAFFRNIDSFIRLVEVGSMVRLHLYQQKIPWFDVRPTTLKKWTTGNGSAKKPAMALSVKQRWGYESPSHDVIDAYALARIGELQEDALLAIKGVTRGA